MDRRIAELLEGPVSVVLATRGDDLVPDLVQASGCRLLADGRVVLLLPAAQAEGVLEHLEAGSPVAVTFSDPLTLRTVQLKAARATVGSPRKADLDGALRHARSLASALERVGYGADYGGAIVDPNGSPMVTVTFTPDDAFEQTPGPNAGRGLTAPGGDGG